MTALIPADGRTSTRPLVIVNAGSSSLKVSVLRPDDTVAAALELDRWDGSPDHPKVVAFLRAARDGAVAVAHRVVHGGRRFREATRIDDQVIAGISELTDLAPLHQPRALAGIKAAQAALPGVPGVACFDTAFHAGLPEAAATYALPRSWTDTFGVRRFGFHGLSHSYAARRAGLLAGKDPGELRIVTCHLGAGASLAAVLRGKSVDTTMGFTPLEGLVMATRSGSVDPGLLIWLQQHGQASVSDLATVLETESGLAGLSGHRGGDMRDILVAAAADDQPARLAVAVYLHRLRREIAAMAAAMDGLDVLVFTGGVGEHSPQIRARAAAGLGFLGVTIDQTRNEATADADISGPGPVRVLVITAREDIEMARQTRALLAP